METHRVLKVSVNDLRLWSELSQRVSEAEKKHRRLAWETYGCFLAALLISTPIAIYLQTGPGPLWIICIGGLTITFLIILNDSGIQNLRAQQYDILKRNRHGRENWYYGWLGPQLSEIGLEGENKRFLLTSEE